MNKKASVAAVKRIFKERGAAAFGWLGFKHCLMDYLEIPRNQKWDVPPDWQKAFKKACGRKDH
jgi:hypothetical protein